MAATKVLRERNKSMFKIQWRSYLSERPFEWFDELTYLSWNLAIMRSLVRTGEMLCYLNKETNENANMHIP